VVPVHAINEVAAAAELVAISEYSMCGSTASETAQTDTAGRRDKQEKPPTNCSPMTIETQRETAMGRWYFRLKSILEILGCGDSPILPRGLDLPIGRSQAGLCGGGIHLAADPRGRMGGLGCR
jgi:hypothetical protein